MFVISDWDGDIYRKYFQSYEQAEKVLLGNGYEKRVDAISSIFYVRVKRCDDLMIDGEVIGNHVDIIELKPYELEGVK